MAKKKPAKPLTAFGTDLTSPGAALVPGAGVSLQDAQNNANSANDLRYNQGLGTLVGGGNTAQGSIEAAIAASAGVGNQAKNRVATQLTNDLGSDQQRATSRGLGNTTVLNAMNDQSKRRSNDANADIDEQVANRLTNLKLAESQLATQNAGSIASFIGQRNDVAPDTGMYAGLTQAAAANKPSTTKTVSTTLSPQFRADMAAGLGDYQPGQIQQSVQQAPTVSGSTYFKMSDMYPPATPAQGTKQIPIGADPGQYAGDSNFSPATFKATGVGQGGISITPSLKKPAPRINPFG